MNSEGEKNEKDSQAGSLDHYGQFLLGAELACLPGLNGFAALGSAVFMPPVVKVVLGNAGFFRYLGHTGVVRRQKSGDDARLEFF